MVKLPNPIYFLEEQWYTMKISEKTISILKNFSSIYSQFLFRPGSIIRTATETEDVFVFAHIDEDFPLTAGIHDLPKFLGILSLFSEPDLEFGEHQVCISSGRQKVHYTYASEKVIKAPPEGDLELDRALTFKLPSSEISRTIKGTSVLGHSSVAIVGRDGRLLMEGLNLNNPTADTFELDIGETDKTFRMIVPKEKLQLLPRDYEVCITRNHAVEFAAPDVTYLFAVDTSSEFDQL